MNIRSFEKIAKSAYQAYRKQAGFNAFNGQMQPSWDELGEEWQACWVAAVKQVVAEVAVS